MDMYTFGEIEPKQSVKKVLALHDLSCFGRCALVPITAVISCMGHQCVPVPTAVFSAHMAIDGWVCTDLTAAVNDTLGHFTQLGLAFEAVYAGFLSTAEQIDSVIQAVKTCRAPDGLFLMDPVMGDNGKVYKTYTPEMTVRMRELCMLADIITPNTTEAAMLLGYAPAARPENQEQAEAWCAALYARYGAQVVLTGLDFIPDEVVIACCADGKTDCIRHERLGCYYPGTGDLFAAVLLGGLLRGEALRESAQAAGAFVRACIRYTAERGSNPLYGVQFEPLLGALMQTQ